MKLGDLDIIGDGGQEKLRLTIRNVFGVEPVIVILDATQTERLITYLKGLRDGLGWNKKTVEDRSS